MRRTNNDLFNQVEELTLKNEKLERENKSLRAYKAEALALRAKVTELRNSIEERISKAVEEAVATATAPLLAKINDLKSEVLRLKSQLNKDSSNSSKPSSRNVFKKIPNNRESSDKKLGGQLGHEGSKLNIPENLEELKMAGKAEHIIILEGVSETESYISDWEIDLKIVPIYIERRRPVGSPPKISYGKKFQALAIYLSVIGLVSINRLSEFFRELTYGAAKLSHATLAKFTRNASDEVNLEPLIEDLLNGEVIHVDETPIKTTERLDEDIGMETAQKTTFNVYIRTYSNETTTVLTVSAHKTEDSVILDNILTLFYGIISHDHEAKFYKFGDMHATCGAHLSRELKGMEQLQMLNWAAEFRDFLLGMNQRKNDDVRDGINVCEPMLLRQFELRYDELVDQGAETLNSMEPKSFGYAELQRMVNRLTKYKDSHMLFIRNYTAPFTYNQAERDLRHCKTKQKISGCFRS